MLLGHLAAALLALLIGATLGGLGSGGSITTLPVLVYVARIDPRSAVAMSLAIVGGTSLAGAWLHARRGNFDPRAAMLFGCAGMPGAWAGSNLTRAVPPHVLMLLFAALMLVVGSALLAGGSRADRNGTCGPLRCAAIGFAVGLLTGFLGVGGGFLIVPALVMFAGTGMRRAVGTSLAIIALNSAAGLAGQVRFTRIDWPYTLCLLASALLGMTLGVAAAGRIPTATLKRALAAALVVAGVAIGGAQIRSLLF